MNKQDIEKIFGLAVSRERAANKFYKAVAERVGNAAVRAIFLDLAKEEEGHLKLLLGMRKNPALGRKFSAAPPDYKVSETETAPALTLEMRPRDAVAVAMKKEQQAVELYRSLAAAAKDKEIRALFEKLAHMELGHKNKLENVFVEIGYPEVF